MDMPTPLSSALTNNKKKELEIWSCLLPFLLICQIFAPLGNLSWETSIFSLSRINAAKLSHGFNPFISKIWLEVLLSCCYTFPWSIVKRIWVTIKTKSRLQNSPYFCVFNYALEVKQNVRNEAENRERDCSRASRAQDSYATLYRFLYWFWEKKPTVLQSRQNPLADSFAYSYHISAKLRIDNVRRRYMTITSAGVFREGYIKFKLHTLFARALICSWREIGSIVYRLRSVERKY